MRHPHGDSGPARRPLGRSGLRARMERLITERSGRRAGDTPADSGATALVRSLEGAVLALDTQPAGFEEATRKSDHVEELRRVLGILLDVLADWEMLAEREARGSPPPD